MGHAMTTVSVIIPARNAAPWIGDALCSVAAQTLAACEVIVIDDASTDDTCAVVHQMQATHPEIVLHRNQRHIGAGASRNIGILKARGDWLAFLDADDWFAPTRLQRLTDLGDGTGANIVADNLYFTLGPGHLPLRTLIAICDGNPSMIDLDAFLRRDRLVTIGNLGLLKPIFRRDFLKGVGIGYDEDPAIKIGEDSLFYIRCLMTGERILLTDEALYFYRRHSAALTNAMTIDSVRVLVDKRRELIARLRADSSPSLAEAIAQTLSDQHLIVAYFELVALLRGRRWLAALLRLLASRGRAFFLVRRAAQGLLCRLSESTWRQSMRPEPRFSPARD
jgi:succinoglycan biosynthesis protein ExoO